MKQMLNPNRVEEIFAEALAKPPDERAAWLEQACAGDAELRGQVEQLLAAHLDVTNALPLPVPPQYPVESAGVKIGRYQLLEQIGEGGFGVVFMAEQTSPVRRRVALKIIKLGMDTRQVVARFEAERQALAMMDHPNIARVFDGGATETGRPYFVMELVRGTPITKYCDENHFSIPQRLELFVQTCTAVQHAHQKGIIHRDLKPTNVMVTVVDGKPVPKVIDFGIAKATAARLTERTLFTEFHQMIGTPEYMSPEQADANAADIDTRSDVYSLGVLLYELLVGATPFDPKELRSKAYAEMQRVIRDVDPPRPSTRLSQLDALPSVAATRQIEPRKLETLLQGELDWIVMRCLEKERNRRYETASALARDVEHYLADKPVQACPPSVSYRLRKFSRRYRLPFAVAAGFLMLLVAGTIVSTYQAIRIRAEQEKTLAQKREADGHRQRAERERDRAVAAEQNARIEAHKSEQVAAFMTDMLKGVGPSVALGRDTTMLREILEKTTRRFDQLKGQPLVEAELRTVLGEVYLDLGDNQSAEAMFRVALALRRELLGDKHVDVATSLTDVGEALSQRHQWIEAENLLVEGLAIQREMLANDHPAVARTIFRLGLLYNRQGRPAEAEPRFREALAIYRRDPGADIAGPLGQLGVALTYQAKYSEAEPFMREGLALARKSAPSGSPGVAYRLHNLGWLLRDAGRLEEAEPLFREALEIRLKQLGASHSQTAVTRIMFAESLRRQRKFDEAEALAEQARATAERQYGQRHTAVVSPLYVLGRIRHDQGRLGDAEAYLREALAIAEQNSPDDWSTHSSRVALGCVLVEQKRYGEAETLLLSSFRAVKRWEGGIPSWGRLPMKEAAQALLQLYETTGQTQKLPQWQKELRDLEAEAAQLLGIPQTQPAPAAPPSAATQPVR